MAKNAFWKDKKRVIAFYSYSGHTRFVAAQIGRITDADIWEIHPKNKYPSEYSACVEQARKEIQQGFFPELTVKNESLPDYDLLFIGSPNWWSTLAPPVATFLRHGNYSGKIVVPFITHGGGGLARCVTSMKQLCPESKFLPAGVFQGENIRREPQAIAQWLSSLSNET